MSEKKQAALAPAADFDEDGRIFVKDVSELIDYLLQNDLRKK